MGTSFDLKASSSGPDRRRAAGLWSIRRCARFSIASEAITPRWSPPSPAVPRPSARSGSRSCLNWRCRRASVDARRHVASGRWGRPAGALAIGCGPIPHPPPPRRSRCPTATRVVVASMPGRRGSPQRSTDASPESWRNGTHRGSRCCARSTAAPFRWLRWPARCSRDMRSPNASVSTGPRPAGRAGTGRSSAPAGRPRRVRADHATRALGRCDRRG